MYSVEAVIWPSVIFLLSIPRGSEHAKHREDVIILRDYSASLNSLFCTIIELRTCKLDAYFRDPYSFFHQSRQQGK